MKILRVRRGFTTNSSGTNEYLPSPVPGGEANLRTYVEQAAQQRDAGGAETSRLEASRPVGLLGLAVLALFVVDRLVRRIRARGVA